MFKKIMEELEDDLNNSDEEDSLELNESEVLKKIPSFSNERLADLIVAYRYIGFYKDLSVAAMQELSSRRENGSEFMYEEYIENNLNDLPKLNFNFQGISSLINEIQKLKIK